MSNLLNAGVVMTKKRVMLSNDIYGNGNFTKLRDTLRKDKKISKDKDVKVDNLAWIVRSFLISRVKELEKAKQDAINKVRQNRQRERNQEEKNKRAAGKAKRNKAAQNKLNLLNNNVRKILTNTETTIKQVQKDISAIKRKDKQGYKKLNALNPKLSEFYKLNINEGLTGNERQAYKKLEKEHDDIMNTLKKQVENRRAKENELEKLRLLKAKILQNIKNDAKKAKEKR